MVYLTTNFNNGITEKTKLREPFGYITKPFGDSELKSAIEIALQA